MIRIAVVGSLVDDHIQHGTGRRTRDLGGIAYAVGALSALGGAAVRIVPIARLAAALAPAVRARWQAAGNVELESLIATPGAPARVELVYSAVGGGVGGDREERLLHPPPPLLSSEVEGPAAGADRILINCITGSDLTVEAAERLAALGPPVHLDLHSLMLARLADGTRRPRRPRDLVRWAAVAETLQCNRQEATLAAAGAPFGGWLSALPASVRMAVLTAGAEGAALYRRRSDGVPAAPLRLPAPRHPVVDPTGAGDVLGAAFVLARARGAEPEAALQGAVSAASASCGIAGSAGLRRLADGGEHPASSAPATGTADSRGEGS